MIALTLGECLDAEQALTRLAAQPAPPKTAYHVAKLLRLVRVETALFHEQRDAIIKECASPAEIAAGVLRPDNADAFRRLKELAAVPVEIDLAPLTQAEIDPFPTVRADDLMHLGACLVEPS